MPLDGLPSGSAMPQSPPQFLGILGGMGPLAGADFLVKLLEETHGGDDDDHIPHLMLQWPQIPNRTPAILEGGPSPLPAMSMAVSLLEASGVAAICIPCVTAHHWYPELADIAKVPILHIVDAVLQSLQESKILPNNLRRRSNSGNVSRPFSSSKPRIGVLATRGTIQSGFFQRKLAMAGYECVVNNEEELEAYVGEAIRLTKYNKAEAAAPLLEKAVKSLVEQQQAERAVLACTELPLLVSRFKDPDLASKCLDVNRSLAKYCVRWWRQNAHS